MKIAIAIVNGGDGSARAVFFEDEACAEEFLSKDEERFSEDVYTVDLPLDIYRVGFRSETQPNTENKKYFYPSYYRGQLIT